MATILDVMYRLQNYKTSKHGKTKKKTKAICINSALMLWFTSNDIASIMLQTDIATHKIMKST
jgi:hypothetical protein